MGAEKGMCQVSGLDIKNLLNKMCNKSIHCSVMKKLCNVIINYLRRRWRQPCQVDSGTAFTRVSSKSYKNNVFCTSHISQNSTVLLPRAIHCDMCHPSGALCSIINLLQLIQLFTSVTISKGHELVLQTITELTYITCIMLDSICDL